MRTSRRLGLYGCKRTVIVSAYGAAKETITLTDSKGYEYEFTANNGSTKEIPIGTYTATGTVSPNSKTVTITKDTTRFNMWPDNATVYYWHGYSPLGSWKVAETGAGHYDHDTLNGTPTCNQNTNNVYFASPSGYSTCATIYLPKTTISGKTLKLTCSDAYQKGYGSMLQLVVTTSVGKQYKPATYKTISSNATSVSLSISEYSGGSYYLGIFGATCNNDGGAVKSTVRIKELYSV